MRLTLLLLAFLTGRILFAQEEDTTSVKAYDSVDVRPDFPGGMPAFFAFLAENMKYPMKASRNGIQGRVYIQFVIGKDGLIEKESVMVVKGVDPLIDDEAVRVVKLAPPFTPGSQDGKPVRVRMILPIIFSLDK